ncbi:MULTISPECIES: hypothetical protein [Providencia]|nr:MULTISPECIES: hypothetical protein [Providencia]MDT7047861.1 hypothetical protein [Providencia stuartii]
MGLFNSEPKIYRNFDSRVFIGSSVSNAKMITNLGLVKASVMVKAGKFINEDEVLKNELMSISIENGGNAIINFRIETGNTAGGSGWFSSFIIAYGDAVFIEYND